MEIIDLKDIVRKDSLIHYINKYECIIVYKDAGEISEHNIGVILEKTAFGTTNIQLENTNDQLSENTDLIKDFINEQCKKGILV